MNVEALKALAKDIENMADITWGLGGCDARKAFPLLWKTAMDAYCGSLDAAMALHEAVLPGWGFEVAITPLGGPMAVVWSVGLKEMFDASAPDPARAWLLAIIRALIAQAEVAG